MCCILIHLILLTNVCTFLYIYDISYFVAKNSPLTSGFTCDTNSSPPELKSCVCLSHLSTPSSSLCRRIDNFFLVVMTSSFAALIIQTATRGHHLTNNANMVYFSDEDGLFFKEKHLPKLINLSE